MSVRQADFLASLDSRAAEIVDSCTRCGKCVEVCPMPGLTGIDASHPEGIVSGVLEILREGKGPEASARWASVCTGSGHCIAACDYGVNPRFMLALARRAVKKGQPEENRREAGKKSFKDMSRGVKVLSRLQLPPALLERLNPSSHPERSEPPDLIFYTGCNMLKTPHIGLLCLDVLDRLGISYEVYGGPANCCGVLQWRPGDDVNSGRQGYKTIERFAQTKTSEVLSWCPTCQIQFGEISLPSHGGEEGPAFDMTMFAVFLDRHLDALKTMMTRPVKKRVALHEHPGALGVVDAVKRVLSAIPELEVVDLHLPQVGYMMTSLRSVPEFRRKLVAMELKAAEEAGVTTLAGIYHADHRELAGHSGQWTFEIINFMELIGESMGLHREDVFKRLKTMRDVDAILADTADMIDAHGLDPEEVREVVLKDIIGEQHLPADRSKHDEILSDGR
jgi:Fe-S oxidoreductase